MVEATRRVRTVFLLLAVLVTACGGGSTGPSQTPQPPSSASSETSDAPTLASQPPTSVGPSGITLDPAVPRACLGLDEQDCVRALEAAATLLAHDAPPVGYVEVGPFGCPAGVGCDTSLIARPAGRVLFEFGAADAIEISVQLGDDGRLAVDRMESFGIRLAPSSLAGQLAGPRPFSLGHCGLWSGVDLDGSWWDPVGFVNADHGDSINATDGTFVPADPNHATFTSAGGFSVNLVRRIGEKWLPLCQ